ncbi:TVP38/TMEM64 family protein [Cecembia calidifontis]|uniref:TVP38/TMEM64 family membrane protein n=1 Tax=Cecembia calidifontis TaxID=1187080 RepID=A0A4Q7P7W8_9BACT|nr:VTT domain-containing protein [Cecembia calidifontis]RZS96256.1 putative membrane protein YdjX (TVP38/TMEM64 family) [Cecembia calidifontis]
MEKKQGFFKEFKEASRTNPLMAFAFLWVSIMPSLGTLVLVPFALSNSQALMELNFLDPFTVLTGLIVAAALMGFALMPTTMLAAISGFLLGWKSFFGLVLGYTLATLIGYAWGKNISKNSGEFLLEKYPKAKSLLDQKKGKIGELIFFVRLSPIIPFALSNLLFAFLKSGWKKLIIFGTIGMLPRTTLVFLSGTLVSDMYQALQTDGISGKGWIFTVFLLVSFWGIWKFFSLEKKK